MDNFVEVYKKWLITHHTQKDESLTPAQRTALAIMDNVKKRAWNALPEMRRIEIVAELILDGILPREVATILNVFDAKVVGV